MWENLPQGLLHVTTGLSGLQDGGFKTRAQLRDESGEAPAGLGGGVSDAISFTTDPLVADSIVRGIHEMREAVRDDTGPAAVERMKSEIAAWTRACQKTRERDFYQLRRLRWKSVEISIENIRIGGGTMFQPS